MLSLHIKYLALLHLKIIINTCVILGKKLRNKTKFCLEEGVFLRLGRVKFEPDALPNTLLVL